MEARITPVTAEDFDELAELFREFADFQKQPQLMVNTAEKMRSEAEFIKGFTAKDDGGAILGYTIFFFAYYTWTGKSLYMDDLYVRPQYRGQGLGTKLIREVISFAKDAGCHTLRWQVSKWNEPAIGFYRSLGAQIDDTEINCDLTIAL